MGATLPTSRYCHWKAHCLLHRVLLWHCYGIAGQLWRRSVRLILKAVQGKTAGTCTENIEGIRPMNLMW